MEAIGRNFFSTRRNTARNHERVYRFVGTPSIRREDGFRRLFLRRIETKTRIRAIRANSTQICELVHTQPAGHLARPLSTRGEESAQKAATSQLLKAGLPALHAAAQPIKDFR